MMTTINTKERIVLLSLIVFGALLPVPCMARTYTTNFPLSENPISEGSNWVNGKANGLDWADIRTTPGLAFGTEPGTSKYDDSTALLTGSWGPDQTVQATVRSVNQQSSTKIWEEVEIRLRSSISAHANTGYEVLFELPPHNFCQVVRWNGRLGDWTSLGYLGKGVHDGDVVKATIVGNVITVYVNGVSQGQVTDSTYANGSPGMGFYLEGTTGVNSDYGFTSFTATDGLPSSSASTVPGISFTSGEIRAGEAIGWGYVGPASPAGWMLPMVGMGVTSGIGKLPCGRIYARSGIPPLYCRFEGPLLSAAPR